MAKRAAGGRSEVYRVQLHRDLSLGASYNVTRLLMSDGKVLEQVASMRNDNTMKEITGWTVRAKLGKAETPEQWLSNYISKNWERVQALS
jgi:hypothetical protein